MSLFDSKTRLAAAVADWRRRCIHLATALRTAARDDDAWQWRIHLRILSYLLRRYGHVAPAPLDSPPPAEPFTEAEPTVYPLADPTEGRPPRSREEIRIVLIRIAVANGSGTWSRPLVRAA